MGFLIALFWIALTLIAIFYVGIGLFWIGMKLMDFQNWCNRWIAERFGV